MSSKISAPNEIKVSGTSNQTPWEGAWLGNQRELIYLLFQNLLWSLSENREGGQIEKARQLFHSWRFIKKSRERLFEFQW